MLDGDIEDKMPTLQVFETKKLGRNKLLHEAELATFDTVEDNVPCDLTFTFLNLTIRGTFVVMVSRSSTSNASLNERTESPEVVAEPNVESFEFVKRERSRRVKQGQRSESNHAKPFKVNHSRVSRMSINHRHMKMSKQSQNYQLLPNDACQNQK